MRKKIMSFAAHYRVSHFWLSLESVIITLISVCLVSYHSIGFIIVAACVMTFEARDSAAKVVPARFKLSTNTRGNGSRLNSAMRPSGKCHILQHFLFLSLHSLAELIIRLISADTVCERRSKGDCVFAGTHAVGSQTNRWDTQIGVYRSSPNDSAYKRVAETAALIHFSKMIG